MGERLGKYQTRPIEVFGWRYIDPNDRNLPQWIVNAINRWSSNGNGIFFDDRQRIHVRRGTSISIIPLGYWLVEQEGEILFFSNEEFRLYYQPIPLRTPDDGTNEEPCTYQ